MIESSEKNYNVTEELWRRLSRRYKIQPGNVMMTREQTGGNLAVVVNSDGESVPIPAGDERAAQMDEFSPWGRALLVGPTYRTDYGQSITPHPRLRPGVRILVGRSTPENYDFGVGGTVVTVGIVSFRSIRVIDLGEEAETDESLDEE